MKKMKLLFLLGITIFQMNANSITKGAKTVALENLSCFNFYDEVDFDGEVQGYYLDDLKTNVFYIPMVNSDDLLLAKQVEGQLLPVIFVSFNKSTVQFKDVNNWKTTISMQLATKKDKVNITAINYFEKNDSKAGLALAGGCLGGSTSACIELSIEACMGDGWCTIMCGLTFPQCVAAITLACAYNCNVQ